MIAAYQQSHRRYHTLEHLDEMLARIETLSAECDHGSAVRLAAWFHDAVYTPEPGDEERSAILAAEVLAGLGVRASLIEEVCRLVRLTTSHQLERDDDRDGAVLCDADLGILAADPERYARYAADVRAEWSAFDDAQFAEGRRGVLERLLSRPALFRTATGETWEAQARHNIETELMLLGV